VYFVANSHVGRDSAPMLRRLLKNAA